MWTFFKIFNKSIYTYTYVNLALLIYQYRYESGVEQLSADAHLLIAQNHQQHILLKNLYTFCYYSL